MLKHNIYRYKNLIIKKPLTKIYMTLHANVHLSTDPSYITDPSAVFKTEQVEILASTNINEVLDKIYNSLIKSVDEFESRGSGWVMDQLMRLDLHVLHGVWAVARVYVHPITEEDCGGEGGCKHSERGSEVFPMVRHRQSTSQRSSPRACYGLPLSWTWALYEWNRDADIIEGYPEIRAAKQY